MSYSNFRWLIERITQLKSHETHGLPGYTGIHFFLTHYRQTLFRTGTFRERVEQKGLHN